MKAAKVDLGADLEIIEIHVFADWHIGDSLCNLFGHETDHGRKMRYSIYCTHGSGGGKKEGGKVNRLADLASIVDTDIYIHSHTHLPVVMKESFYRADSCNSSVKLVDKLFVNTSAQLKYGGYGQVQSMKPACNNNPVIYLDGAN